MILINYGFSKLSFYNVRCIDETGCRLNMTKFYGRSLRGERACGERPTEKDRRISMIEDLNHNVLLDRMCFGGNS